MSLVKPPQPLRWLHLSDFHVGMDEYAQRKLFKEIINDVAQCSQKSGVPDLIFITGDVAHSGTTEQYIQFASEFLTPLQQTLGTDAKERTLIVPGNHDIDLTQSKYFDRAAISETSSHFFDPNNEGLKDRRQLLPRFEAYYNTEAMTPRNWLDQEEGSYSRVFEIGGAKLGVVGINTAWLCKGDKLDRHSLSPGVHLLEDALSQIDSCDAKLVLGHHPIDWFHDEHVGRIRAALGRHSALYLHGHLHRDRVSPEDEAGNGFLTVQSGAAFQTRAHDKVWVNGFLWGELDLMKSELRLRPREWNPDNLEWRAGRDLPTARRLPNSADWWVFPLPSASATATPTAKETVTYPSGWQPVDQNFLNQRREPLAASHAIRFFDGAIPDWRITLYTGIPRLNVVKRALRHLVDNARLEGPQVILLIGPASEGKSTALMQAVDELLQAREEWKVLWRVDDQPHPHLRDELLLLPETNTRWLLVSDDAANIAKEIFGASQLLKRMGRGDLSFLLASRDTDWKAVGAHRHEWITYADFREERVSGLTSEDAHAIVGCWSTFGDDALGRLAGSDPMTRTNLLLRAAHERAQIEEGALLGALLEVRFGKDLNEHVKVLMNRLAERPIDGTGLDLLSAFSYIAIMHAEDLSWLTKPVLAEALGCQLRDITHNVLFPLGREAATSDSGQFIFTRHKSIASAVVQLLPDVFGEDVETKFVELALAAQRLLSENTTAPFVRQWEHELARHFASKGNMTLALRIGDELLRAYPHDTSLRTNLSRLLRKTGESGKAVKLFRDLDLRSVQRAVFVEWGVAEYELGELGFGSFLLALSLADQANRKAPNIKSVRSALISLTAAFEAAYDKYLDRIILKGCAATARLALLVHSTNEYRTSLYRRLRKSGEEVGPDHPIDDDLRTMQTAISRAFAIEGSAKRDTMNYKESFGRLEFQRLKRLLETASQVTLTRGIGASTVIDPDDQTEIEPSTASKNGNVIARLVMAIRKLIP